MRFVHPEIGVVILIILALLWLVSKRRVATVGHSELGIHKKLLMPIAGRIPTIIFSAMWLMIVIAAGQPELITAGEKQPVLARNIVIAVDNSGSMGDLIVENGDGGTTGGDRVLKSEAARAGVKYFIEQRPDDRIALLTFDDQVYYDWPLTTDHDYLLGMLGAIKANISGGTNFDGPTGPYSKVGASRGQSSICEKLKLSPAKSSSSSLTDKTRSARNGAFNWKTSLSSRTSLFTCWA